MTYKRGKARSIDRELQQARYTKKRGKALELFREYILGGDNNGIDKYGNQIEARKDSFENRWYKARVILLTSK